MRRGNNSEFGKCNDVFWAISLGADFCAEHELGIKGLKYSFGISNMRSIQKKTLFGLVNTTEDIPLVGLESRQITVCPEGLQYFEFKKNKVDWAGLIYTQRIREPWDAENIPRSLQAYGKETLVTAWSENDFGLVTTGDENIQNLKELYEAFINLDVAMYVGKGHAFKNGGLILSIASKTPEDLVNQMNEIDLDGYRLQEAVNMTGIVKKLKDADKGYYALSPRWANDEKTEVKFYLNPHDQYKYNSGFVTVSDLNDWIAGVKGKIIK